MAGNFIVFLQKKLMWRGVCCGGLNLHVSWRCVVKLISFGMVLMVVVCKALCGGLPGVKVHSMIEVLVGKLMLW